MTQEEKQLLLQDLCARLPYDVKVIRPLYGAVTLTYDMVKLIDKDDNKWLPYLRPMLSMTEGEYKELKSISSYYGFAPYEYIGDWCPNYEMVNWLNSHHFDYRGLIEKGLAIAVTKENNPYKN